MLGGFSLLVSLTAFNAVWLAVFCWLFWSCGVDPRLPDISLPGMPWTLLKFLCESTRSSELVREGRAGIRMTARLCDVRVRSEQEEERMRVREESFQPVILRLSNWTSFICNSGRLFVYGGSRLGRVFA